MLVFYANQQSLKINLLLTGDNKPIISKIITAEPSTNEPRISEWLRLNCHVSDASMNSNHSFDIVEYGNQLSPNERSLLYFILDVRTDEPIQGLADVIQRKKLLIDETLLENSNHELERHYVHAARNMNEEILMDKTFLQSEDKGSVRLFKRLLIAYANLRCSFSVPNSELDDLIHQCIQHKLPHWQAYLLVYGHIVRDVDTRAKLREEFAQLNQAHLCFKALGDYLGVTRVFHARASILGEFKRYKSAIRLLHSCLRIRNFLQDPFGSAKISNGIGYIYLQMDQLEDAKEYHLIATRYLKETEQYSELAFTYSQLGWVQLLMGDYKSAVLSVLETLKLMDRHRIQTLSFRTRPDLQAQLGLSYFMNSSLDKAIEHSNYCEQHKIDSTATGDILRTLLRGLVNQARKETELADISFNALPELIEENPDVDIHIELLYLKCQVERQRNMQQHWNVDKYLRRAKELCTENHLSNAAQWFR